MWMRLTETARSALLCPQAEQRFFEIGQKRPQPPQRGGVMVDARDVSERYCNH